MQYSFVFLKWCIIMVISCSVCSYVLRRQSKGECTEGLTESSCHPVSISVHDTSICVCFKVTSNKAKYVTCFNGAISSVLCQTNLHLYSSEFACVLAF